MAKIVATTFAAALILFGLAGCFSPTLFGAHLSGLRNLLNLLAGAGVGYAAQRAGPSAFFWTSGGVGLGYAMWGLGGFLLGRPGTSTLPALPPDDHLLVLVPGWIECARNDHVLHLFFGLAFLIAALVGAAETPFRLRK